MNLRKLELNFSKNVLRAKLNLFMFCLYLSSFDKKQSENNFCILSEKARREKRKSLESEFPFGSRSQKTQSPQQKSRI